MDKMTHLKFNLNNFLFAISDALDFIHMKNLHGISFNSKRIAYIALKIATLNEMPKEFLSDLLSYSLIAHNPELKTNLEAIPFNNITNIQREEAAKILAIASFFELQIAMENNFISNREQLIETFECKDCFDEIYTENLLYLMEYDSFWFDLTNIQSLPFKILDMIDDFTFEYSYDNLISFTKLFNSIYYEHTQRTPSGCIEDKLRVVAQYYNFDQKDTSRLIISGHLAYLGFLLLPKEIYTNITLNSSHEIKSIPYNTKEILTRVFGFDDIVILASIYNENIDGSGYPYKKEGNQLSLKFRVFTIIYRLQALLEERNYRKSFSVDESFEILKKEAQAGLLDITLLKDIENLMHN
ncbi:MAG TPA: hypothetical protein ENK66_08925 [Arcobacter sp.]|jgi:HD-GYP domain-containing protein (c-di-GMP phosphodiesterase class II)|nr:hypothetical protein [Arcobacter sp.]